MQKTLFFLTALLLGIAPFSRAEQFVSLTMCSDRLLLELARPEQIAAMSPFSVKPSAMLNKINHDKPILKPQLSELLPYLHKTILINERFYPELTEQLKKLKVKIIPINDSPQTPDELFELILNLGNITQNDAHAKQLVDTLKSQNSKLNQSLTDTLILTETGVAEMRFPQYQILLNLLGLTPLKTTLTPQNFSLEKVLLAEPNVLITLVDQRSYNEQAELLRHPILQKHFNNRPHITLPLKYTYCFDHGVWQGAELIYQQLK
ncbi:hypothetical protein [Necropsobacter massiliensis]|uniref:hypothetical protein n=1 Tax=Necropsobacter massiliensis TaxID=1400001 RepID=UPI00059604D7|nr:hypothetical protein [Necropsobacter massiliensis]